MLQKSKDSVLAKLQKIIPQISKNDYHQIEEMSIYQDSFKGFVLPLKYSENPIYKIDHTLNKNDLITTLACIDAEIKQREALKLTNLHQLKVKQVREVETLLKVGRMVETGLVQTETSKCKCFGNWLS